MTSFHTDDLKDSKELKELTLTVPEQDEKFDNLLFISDTSLPTLKLAEFSTIIEYKHDLFANRTLKEIFNKASYLWIDIRDVKARQFISKNLRNSPYSVSLVYTNKQEAWVKEISDFLENKCNITSLDKLKKRDALSAEDLIGDLLKEVVKISKPTSKAIKALNLLCCSGSKKKR